ncbi:ribonuclease H-like domain-containing protein [Tanacetum coccineum]
MTKMPLLVSARTCGVLIKVQILTLDFDQLLLDSKTSKPRGKVKRHSEKLSWFTGRPKRTRKCSKRAFKFLSATSIISKLDISDPLHLHPNDTTALTVVSIKLKGTENYQVWSCAMLLALEGKNKIGFIDGSCKRSNSDEVFGKQWDRKGSSIVDYYHKLNALWKQYDAMIELPKCVCNASEGFKKHNQLLKLMQFLMGLDDSYMQIRSTILSREVLPDVRSAYATISSEESHRVAVGSIAGSSQRNQASAFVSNVPNSQNYQISNQNFSAGPSRPNNLNNNRQSESSGLNNNRQGGGSEKIWSKF